MGYNQNTARSILYGPRYLGGCNLFHLYDRQGQAQLDQSLKFWRAEKEEAGQLLRIAVAWAQFNAGISAGIFDDVWTQLPHLESRLLASLRDYLRTIDARLELDTHFVPEKQRENDSYIMDHVLDSGEFTAGAIK